MKIVCYGDSNTYGYDPRSFFGGRYPAEIRWTDRLAQASGAEVVNAGMNGREIPRRERDLCAAAEQIAAQRADLLIIMLGSNDLLMGADSAEASARMERFLERLKGEHILLVAPPPMQYGEWVTEETVKQESRLLAEAYRVLAERWGVRFADAGEWGIGLAYDGVHFSEEGHRAFAGRVLAVIGKR